MPSRTRTLLLTGGAGFIGSHCLDRLLSETDFTILCVDNFSPAYDPARKRANLVHLAGEPRVELVEASIVDAAAMNRLFAQRRPTHVLHLAAQAGVRQSVARALEFEEANVRGTLVLLEAARQWPVERFVLASSSTVYGAGTPAPFREDAPWRPALSPYGATKQAAEALAFTYHALHGLPVVCVRPFSVYGSRIRPDLAISVFAEAILAGRPLPLLGDGSARRDFTHVFDVCRGLLSALEAPEAVGQAVNLGHDEPVALVDLIAALESRLGRKATIDRRRADPSDLPLTCADLTKARRILGYAPRIGLAEGLDEFVAWYLAGRSGAG
jgi:UDP-glucuronate 4-epimerase